MPRHPDPKGDSRYEERKRWFEHALREGRDDQLADLFARRTHTPDEAQSVRSPLSGSGRRRASAEGKRPAH